MQSIQRESVHREYRECLLSKSMIFVAAFTDYVLDIAMLFLKN